MNDEQKPKEFWIELNEEGNHYTGRLCWATYPGDKPARGNYIKVIEHAAYEALRKRLFVTEGSLEFYKLESEQLRAERDELIARMSQRHIIGKVYDVSRETVTNLANELDVANKALAEYRAISPYKE